MSTSQLDMRGSYRDHTVELGTELVVSRFVGEASGGEDTDERRLAVAAARYIVYQSTSTNERLCNSAGRSRLTKRAVVLRVERANGAVRSWRGQCTNE